MRIDGSVQPVALVITLDHSFIIRNVIRILPLSELETGFLHPVVNGGRHRSTPYISSSETVFESYNPSRWRRIPSFIAQFGVASRSRNPHSKQSLLSLRRRILALITQKSGRLTFHPYLNSAANVRIISRNCRHQNLYEERINGLYYVAVHLPKATPRRSGCQCSSPRPPRPRASSTRYSRHPANRRRHRTRIQLLTIRGSDSPLPVRTSSAGERWVLVMTAPNSRHALSTSVSAKYARPVLGTTLDSVTSTVSLATISSAEWPMRSSYDPS